MQLCRQRGCSWKSTRDGTLVAANSRRASWDSVAVKDTKFEVKVGERKQTKICQVLHVGDALKQACLGMKHHPATAWAREHACNLLSCPILIPVTSPLFGRITLTTRAGTKMKKDTCRLMFMFAGTLFFINGKKTRVPAKHCLPWALNGFQLPRVLMSKRKPLLSSARKRKEERQRALVSWHLQKKKKSCAMKCPVPNH